MRRTRTIASATLVLLATSAGLARNAHALNACTAAQVNSQDPQCPSGTGPCNISRVFEIGNGCTLDFGTRAVTVLGSGEINVLSNTATIRAGSFAVAPGGRVEGRGNLATPPRDRGGFLTVQTTGVVNIQRSGASRGIVDFSGNARAGTFSVIAGGAITVSGDILVNGLLIAGGNGAISLRSGGDIVSASNSTISASGGDQSTGGFVDLIAEGRADLGSSIIVNGGDGGVVDVLSGTEAIIRGINGIGGGDAGSGGCASVFAGTRVQMLGAVVLDGTGSPTLSGGGCGGFIDIESRFGDTTISAPITAESGAPDGGGGGVSVLARGSISQGAAAPISVQGIGPSSCGGEISLEADLDVTASGAMNASGGFGGNLVDLIAGRHVTLNGMVEAQGRDIGSFGGSVTVVAGERGFGNVGVNSSVDVGGGGCGPDLGCGLGGFTEVSGCNVTVGSTASLLARAADGGDNLLTARELLRIQGPVNATSTIGQTNGTNTLQHPSRVPTQITAGTVTPSPTVQSLATCTAAGQTNCLVPCPTCGNGMVEFPETCDQSGTPVSCDGCSVFCRAESCNDVNACTADSCDASLGCRNQPVNDGGSCSDGNVCNGVETCSTGICRAAGPPPNCNDANICTTDSCHPTLGCQTAPAPAGGLCSDGNACTLVDTCNGMGACAPGAPRTCVDGLPCTTDACNPATGCVFTPAPNGTTCDDNAFCTVNDACQAGSCSGGARDCSDSNSCTTDSCDESGDICVNQSSGSCCGDGTVNPGEECDDGNTSNADACLNSCVLPICGDGFVRTGVEQCDAGASNSNAPNAACRLDCTPRRCGDGIIDNQSNEQCDDGGTASGDGCSAACFAEPPATAELIPGRGSATTDCGLEWAYDRPAVDRKGIPAVKQTCRDGDPTCDAGTTAGECTFFVWVCANNTDPQLPACVPGAPGIGNVSTVEVRKPSSREAGLRPVDSANRQQLAQGAAAAQTTAQNLCGPRVAIRVPLKAPDKKGVKTLKLVGTTDKNLRDSDVLKLFCTP